jgi:hypothetical protein
MGRGLTVERTALQAPQTHRRAPRDAAETGTPGPDAAMMDPEQTAALEAERARQIRLAVLALDRMRTERPVRRRSRAIGWVAVLLVVLGLTVLLPRFMEQTSRDVHIYDGGADPQTGLTHRGPPPPAPPDASAPVDTRPAPGRRPPDHAFSARRRFPIEP